MMLEYKDVLYCALSSSTFMLLCLQDTSRPLPERCAFCIAENIVYLGLIEIEGVPC